jgi:hypothetical protein
MVAHACNPTHSEGGDSQLGGQPRQKVLKNPILTNNNFKKAGLGGTYLLSQAIREAQMAGLWGRLAKHKWQDPI